MSTRCLICRENRKGIVRGIYCHQDGYPDGVGAMLFRCYRSAKTLDALFRRGDISSLGPTPTRGTHAYGYDARSGLDDENAPFVGRVETLMQDSHHDGIEWVYLWRDHEWFVAQDVWEKGLTDFEPLPNRLSGAGESDRLAESRHNELRLSIELSLILTYLYRYTNLAWPFAQTKYHQELLKEFKKAGYVKKGQLTELGLDVAWHLIEKYHMDSGVDPQEPLIIDQHGKPLLKSRKKGTRK